MTGLHRTATLLLAFASVACVAEQKDGGEPTEGGGAAGAPAGAGGRAGAAGATGAGNAGGMTACAGGHLLRTIRGAAVDDAGAPVTGARAQTCLRVSGGKSVCLPPLAVEAGGTFALDVPTDLGCVERAVLRITAPGTRHATLYCPVQGPPDTRFDAPFVLTRIPAPSSLPPAGARSAARPVVFAGGLEVDVVPDALLADADDPYAALAAGPALADPRCAPAADAMFAFAPEMEVTGTFSVRLPNVTKLAAGTKVELLVLGGLDCRLPDDTSVPEGALVPFGVGTVDASGKSIAGVGLPCLTWVGYRAKSP